MYCTAATVGSCKAIGKVGATGVDTAMGVFTERTGCRTCSWHCGGEESGSLRCGDGARTHTGHAERLPLRFQAHSCNRPFTNPRNTGA